MITRPGLPNPATHIDGLLLASASRDPALVRHRLDLAMEALGTGRCLDEVLFPALRQIGRRWQNGHLDIATERLATEAARGWLEDQGLRAPEPNDAPPVLLACGPADVHSIGIEALGVLLRQQRRQCRLLGAQISVRALTTAVRVNRPSGVVVVSHLRANRLSTTQALRAAAALGAQVFYAGDAFGSVRLRRNVPGTHLDTTLQGACALILDTPKRTVPD